MAPEDDRSAALRLIPVSRETTERLDVYVALLGRWRRTVNLISEPGFRKVWTRHIADCLQLLSFAPEAKIWVDMGSGAGLPGLIIAIQLVDIAGARVHLIESDQRKCAFLREAARETGAPAIVHNLRIENAPAQIADAVDAVTARALAPLPRLIAFARIWLEKGAIGLFPRGKTPEATNLSDFPEYQVDFPRSRTDQMSAIATVRRFTPAMIASSPSSAARTER